MHAHGAASPVCLDPPPVGQLHRRGMSEVAAPIRTVLFHTMTKKRQLSCLNADRLLCALLSMADWLYHTNLRTVTVSRAR